MTLLRRSTTLIALLILTTSLWAQSDYIVKLDLTDCEEDQLKVTILTPKVSQSEVIYQMPVVIPGSYAKKDFGRFIEKPKAYNSFGKRLKMKKLNDNQYLIKNATELGKIEYVVNDTWDAGGGNYVFQPGGTNFEEGKNFMLNHHALYGYLEGYKMRSYTIDVKKPEGFYAATSLDVKSMGRNVDRMTAENYVVLVDNPVMYSVPDTTSFMAGNMKVMVSVYSSNDVVKSADIAEFIQPLGDALANFFGELPVDEYNFIMYFPGFNQRDIIKGGGFGALEHSYSSVYFMPEMSNRERLSSTIKDVCAHEFLHILTPLNIQSEEISNFDFADPKMSKHLWMYEGVVEYFSHLTQLKDSLKSIDDFLYEMRSKLLTARKYSSESFTVMSENILKDKYQDMYVNVYYKGALIGFLLDIRLLELSNGEIGLRELMLTLAGKYGPNKPFKDDELFDEIVELTYPEIRDFFNSYVIGSEKLPMEDYLDKAGLIYNPKMRDTILYFGDIDFDLDSDIDQMVVEDAAEKQNAFGLISGDVILSVNNQAVTADNFREVEVQLTTPDSDEELNLEVIRDGSKLTLAASPDDIPVFQLHYMGLKKNPSPNELKLRKRLL